MKKVNLFYISILILWALSLKSQSYITAFEKNNNYTVTYEEGIDYWKKLSGDFKELSMVEIGKSDIGKPIHALILSKEGYVSSYELQRSEKPLLLINNAIHAGEPCGVDATMMLFRDILQNKIGENLLDEIDVVAIPFYNIGGVLKRNSTTRTNQNGPEAYGFRGNAKNLDLNRDFIKADSKNAKTLIQLITKLKPEIFVDNHTTNGADYQAVMTLISSMQEHYTEELNEILQNQLNPFLFKAMNSSGFGMVPYVYSIGDTPFDGILQFKDLPRYSMGYAALHNTLSFTAEAHMLKPYDQRVRAVYYLNYKMMEWLAENGKSVQSAKNNALKTYTEEDEYVLKWVLDTTQYLPLEFPGYEPVYEKSEVSGKERLFYDRKKPVTKIIKFFHRYKPEIVVKKPKLYVIPQAYSDVIDRLKWNGVKVAELKEDRKISGTQYKIVHLDTRSSAYEGHYLHSNVVVDRIKVEKQCYKGDVVVEVDQPMSKYILETMEPQGEDSFLAWNFFDGILMQKEHFSPYIFEDEAAKLLAENPEWKKELEEKKSNDPEFANNAWAQLYFIYKKTNHYEPWHNLYPILRVDD